MSYSWNDRPVISTHTNRIRVYLYLLVVSSNPIFKFNVMLTVHRYYISTTGPTGCTVCFQFITVNSLYMVQGLICLSSGGNVYTAVGIFCVYCWLAAIRLE
jgi:hypothetical protein